MEKLVYEYLNSMVGGNPILMKMTMVDPSWIDNTLVENFYVNEVRVGSIRNHSSGKVLIEKNVSNSLMMLFDLDKDDSYLYFRKWINKLEVENGVVSISPGPDSLRSR